MPFPDQALMPLQTLDSLKAKGDGVAEDEMVRQHRQVSGHEFEQTPRDGKGQRSLACCSPWGHKELDTT